MYAAIRLFAPTTPTTDVINGILTNDVELCDGDSGLTTCKAGANVGYVTNAELGVAVVFATCTFGVNLKYLPLLGGAVAHIICLVPFKEMIPASATDSASIAAMECEWNRPASVCEKEGHSMNKVLLVLNRDNGVAVMHSGTSPNPTWPEFWAMPRDGSIAVEFFFEPTLKWSDAVSLAEFSFCEQRCRFALALEQWFTARLADSDYSLIHRAPSFGGRSHPRPVARRGGTRAHCNNLFAGVQ
jgi:hypothetical protein